MKSFTSKVIRCSATLGAMLLAQFAGAQINAGNDTSTCPPASVTLTATVTPVLDATTYSISSIPYTPNPTTGTPVTLTDDSQSGVLPIGFSFNFFGTCYTQFYIGSNGWIAFSPQPTTYTSATIPSTLTTVPKNCIMGPWQDWQPGIGTGPYIRYQTLGTAPFRRLVVSYTNIPMYSCTSTFGSFQIVIYETTNIIENFLTNKPNCTTWAGGTAVQGIHDATGTMAFTVPGRNSTQWTATNEGWRYTPAGAASYTVTWSDGTSTIGFGTSVTVSPTVTTNYIATVTYPCTTLRDTVMVLAGPMATAGSNATICQGASTTLNAGGGLAYAWSPATGLSATNIPNPVANPTTTTTYTVMVTDAGGCSNPATVTVNVNPLPSAFAGVDAAVCPGGSTTLGAAGGTSFAWSPATGLSATNIANPVASPSVTTNYVVAVTNNGCTRNDTVQVAVLAPPLVSAGADLILCTGNTTTLSATGATSYTWGPATGLNNTAASNPTASPSVTTTYTVTGTDANGCMNNDTVTVLVYTATVAASSNTAICGGDSVQISASGANVVSYAWSPASSLSSATVSNPIAFPSATTTYTVTSTDVNGCTAQASVTITYNALPNADAGANVAVCQGTGTVLSASGGSNYSWSPASGLASTTTSSTNASPSVTTTYTVMISDNNGCMNVDSVTVTVNALPAANAGPNVSVCQGNSTQLNATGGTQYSWSPATGLSNTAISNPVANPTITSTYTVTVTNANGCINIDAVTVIVNPTPTANAGADAFVCQGSSTQLTANNLSGATYNWSPPSGLNNAGIMNPVATPPATTTYTVTVTNAGGCSATDMVTVTVNNNPTPSLTSQDAVCGDDDGQITATPTGSNFMYTLNGGTPQSSPMFTNLSPGTYTITVTDAAGCTGTQTTTVGQVNNANASFTASPLTGQVPLPVNFTNNSTGANNYFWDFGNGSSTTTQNGSATYTTGGTYQVMLIVYNNNTTCADTAMVTIIAEELVEVEIPNVFTPNGDGKNDIFVLTSKGLSQVNGEIYNRWGKRVSEWSGSPSNGWNGKTDGGAEAQDGVYYYIISTVAGNGDVKEYKGFVQLIRSK